MKENLNIALFSPSQNPYSETFIQAHKNLLPGNVSYYYGHAGTIKIEGGTIPNLKKSFFKKVLHKLMGKKDPQNHWKPLAQSLKDRFIDVILIEYGTHAYSLLPFLRLIGIPFVVHFHGYDAFTNEVIARCENYTTIFDRASAIVAVSLEMKSQLLSLGSPSHKVFYNPNAPEDLFLEAKTSFAKNQLLSVGRFTDKKAPYFTILAYSEIAHKFKDSRLLLVGNGVLYNMCDNLIKHLKLQEQVILLGVKTPEEIVLLMEESRAFVQHSIIAQNGDREGMPIAVLEAGAIGLPVIATRHAGINDIILEQETGLLCDEGDVYTMANHMERLLKNKEEAILLGNNAKQRIISEFSMHKHINGLYKILEDAANG